MPKKVAPIPKESLQNRVVKSIKKAKGPERTRALISERLPDSPLNKIPKTPIVKAKSIQSKSSFKTQNSIHAFEQGLARGEKPGRRTLNKHQNRKINHDEMQEAHMMDQFRKERRRIGVDRAMDKIERLEERMSTKS